MVPSSVRQGDPRQDLFKLLDSLEMSVHHDVLLLLVSLADFSSARSKLSPRCPKRHWTLVYPRPSRQGVSCPESRSRYDRPSFRGAESKPS